VFMFEQDILQLCLCLSIFSRAVFKFEQDVIRLFYV